MSGDLRQLVYLSNASYGLGKQDIEDIVATSRRNNEQSGVSGMLLYSSGLFIQAIEGAPETIARLYQTISDDRRHEMIETLSDRQVAERSFSGWAMGFVEKPPEDVGQEMGIAGALDRTAALAALDENEELAVTILRDFSETLY